MYIDDLKNELEIVIKMIKNNTFTKITNQEKIDFINVLNATSYEGLVSDPFNDENCISEKNIATLKHAIESVINTKI
jgi:hypothetical protein